MENNENVLIPDFDDFEIVVDIEDAPDFSEQKNDDKPEVENIEPEVEEVEEDEIEEETEEINEDEENESDVNVEILKATSKTLFDEGIIELEEGEEIKDWEDLKERLRELPQLAVNTVVEQAPDLTKMLLQFAFTKGENISKENLKDFYETYLKDLDNQDIVTDFKEVDEARKFLHQEYKEKGLSDFVIESTLDALEDKEEDGKALFDEAKKLAENKKKVFESSNKLDNEIKASKKEEEEKKQFFSNVQQELANTGWKKPTIQKVASAIQTGEANKVLREAAFNHPKALIQLATLATFWDDKKKEFDFESFVKQIQSKEIGDIKTKIEKDHFSSISTKTRTNVKQPKTLSLENMKPIIEFD